MILSLRGFVAVGLVVLVAIGCQKGTQSGTEGNRAPSDVGADSKGTEAKGGGRVEDAQAAGSRIGARGLTLTEPDNGTAVDLRLGQVLTVVLDCNRSAGFSWSLAEPTATVIVPEGKPVYAAASTKAGAGGSDGTETWRFRAAQRGQQTVRLEYRRAWQQNVPERTFGFAATVR